MKKIKTAKSKFYKSDIKAAWIFVSPFIFGFLFIYLDIIIESLKMSFSDLKMSPTGYLLEFIGLNNYKNALFVDPYFNNTATSSIISLVMNVPAIIIFSLFIATILNQKMAGRGIFRVIFFIPVILATGIVEKVDSANYMISSLSSGIDVGLGYAGGVSVLGNITQILQGMYVSPNVINFIIGFVNNIYTLVNMSGVQILLFLAGLQAISGSIYESAQIEGATGWDTFWKITFPMISPIILVNAIYTVIDFLTRSSNGTMDLIYRLAFKSSKHGIASAMAWIYFALILIVIMAIALFVYKIMKKNRG